MTKMFLFIDFLLCMTVKEKNILNLEKKRRDGYLVVISQEDIDVNELHKYRICSVHFVSGWPADLYDTTSPNWLPTMNLGHEKSSSG